MLEGERARWVFLVACEARWPPPTASNSHSSKPTPILCLDLLFTNFFSMFTSTRHHHSFLGSGIHQLFQMFTPIRQHHFFAWIWYPPRFLFLRCLGTVGTRCAWAQRAGALSKSVWFCKSSRFRCHCHCPQMRSVICPKAPSQWWGIICPKASPSMREHLRGALLS